MKQKKDLKGDKKMMKTRTVEQLKKEETEHIGFIAEEVLKRLLVSSQPEDQQQNQEAIDEEIEYLRVLLREAVKAGNEGLYSLIHDQIKNLGGWIK